MPKKQENKLPLMLVDRKSVFYRQHRDQRVYHNMQIMQVDRGIVVKSLDTRHLDWHEGLRLISDAITRPCKNEALKSRLSLIDSSDPFGLNDLQVNYSLSKKKRWLLTSHFEQNAETYQRPDLKVSTVLATSEFPSIFGSDDHEMFKNSRGWNADEASHVKCLISCDTQGLTCVFENKRSRGQVKDFLSPLSTEIKIEKKPSRKLKKRERQLVVKAEQKLQIAPIRITYQVFEPHSTVNQLNGFKESPDWRKHVKVSKKYSSRILDPLQLETESLDFDVDGSFDEEDTEGQKPSTLTIGDFVQPQTTEQSNRTSSESDYEFVIAGIQHGLSLDDYDFSD